jgi:outer membrane lipase/esterase
MRLNVRSKLVFSAVSAMITIFGSRLALGLKSVGKSLGLGVCAASLFALGSPSSAAPIYSIVAFGDSLTDIGNNQVLFGNTPSSSIVGNSFIPNAGPYESGTYSNGPIWADYLATTLGLPPLGPSLLSPAAGGMVFAYGGARVNAPTPGVPIRVPLLSIQQQINLYLTGTGNTASTSALYAIAGGGNDARQTLTNANLAFLSGTPIQNILPTIQADASTYAINVEGQVKQLRDAGAKDLLVWNVPNLGLTPSVLELGSATSEYASTIAMEFNSALSTKISGIPGLTLFDAFSFSSTSLTSNTSPFAAQGSEACGAFQDKNCNNYFFWDGLHPTTAAHSSIAQAIYANLGSPTPVPGPLPILGAAAAFRYSRKLRKRIKDSKPEMGSPIAV